MDSNIVEAMPRRRLSDKILTAFDHACDKREIAVAEHLLRALELALTSEGGPGRIDLRRNLGPVLEAYERLLEIKATARDDTFAAS